MVLVATKGAAAAGTTTFLAAAINGADRTMGANGETTDLASYGLAAATNGADRAITGADTKCGFTEYVNGEWETTPAVTLQMFKANKIDAN